MPRLHAFYRRFHGVTTWIDSTDPVLALNGWSVLTSDTFSWPRNRYVLNEPRNVNGYPDFRVEPLPGMSESVLLCKGRTAWELFGLYPSGYVLVRENGVSGSGAYREFPSTGVDQPIAGVRGHYLWTREQQRSGNPGESWECTFDQYADTRVAYYGILSLGNARHRARLLRLLGGSDFAAKAIEDWGAISAQLHPERRNPPPTRLIVRQERWGQDFEHVEYYVEGSAGRIPLSRIGWIKSEIIDGQAVVQRISCYHQPRMTTWRPPRHVGIPSWRPPRESVHIV